MTSMVSTRYSKELSHKIKPRISGAQPDTSACSNPCSQQDVTRMSMGKIRAARGFEPRPVTGVLSRIILLPSAMTSTFSSPTIWPDHRSYMPCHLKRVSAPVSNGSCWNKIAIECWERRNTFWPVGRTGSGVLLGTWWTTIVYPLTRINPR